jgi:hypothetical protein
MSKERFKKAELQERMANFGYPRTPMPLTDATVSLLWSSHGDREKKRFK